MRIVVLVGDERKGKEKKGGACKKKEKPLAIGMSILAMGGWE